MPNDLFEEDAQTYVELNGVPLEEGRDYYWRPGKLVLKRARPVVPSLSFWGKVRHLVCLEWGELTRPRYPYPDMVVVENWAMQERDVYLYGSPDFDEYIVYEEDIAEVHRKP